VHGRRAVEHAAAAGRHLALLLVDIDHFRTLMIGSVTPLVTES
jgi:GGDEF domain-containing protein